MEEERTTARAIFSHHVPKKVLGISLILMVVFIWVGSSEAIQAIFQNLSFDKPMFLTYFSTTLFSLYLFGLLVVPRWRKSLFHKSNIVPSLQETVGEPQQQIELDGLDSSPMINTEESLLQQEQLINFKLVQISQHLFLNFCRIGDINCHQNVSFMVPCQCHI